jgi:DNA-binding IclR family transcriptional regulator
MSMSSEAMINLLSDVGRQEPTWVTGPGRAIGADAPD